MGVFMKIELMPVDQVLPYARNPRINAHAVEKVAASIKEFGFRQPIVVDGEMVIVVGHVRYEAAKRLGLKKVPVHVATDLTPQQIKAYRITDNRVGEESEWDKALLQLEIVELEEAAFSAELLGFNDEELRDIKASVDGLLEDGFGKDDDDDIEEADTTARIGGYTFPIPREQYLEWLEALKQSVGFEKKEIIEELKRRLGL
jgi:ParB-like chromosome segregation protein Spo0J